MSENPFSQFAFKELHLFPRGLFLFGLICLGEGVVRNELPSIDVGIICFFGAIGINILYDLRRTKGDEIERMRTEKQWMMGFCVAALALAFIALGLGIKSFFSSQ